METATLPIVPTTLAYAKKVFSRGTGAFGSEDLNRAFDLDLGIDPPIMFPKEEQTRARELDQYLIRQVGTGKDGKPLTVESLCAQFENKLGDGKLFYHNYPQTYGVESFYLTDSPRPGWTLVSRDIIPGSAGVNYIGQTQAISDYLVGKVYGGQELPAVYTSVRLKIPPHRKNP
ncbi:MAG: hypothetical protein NTV72_02655 [Candidatus Taylorbacteria bacterium]|nr:hypothetical protein [Candidatus Taylorbacteria bacterium]